jgi:hypothetical protein
MGLNQGDVIDVGDNAPTLAHREASLVEVPIDLGHDTISSMGFLAHVHGVAGAGF